MKISLDFGKEVDEDNLAGILEEIAFMLRHEDTDLKELMDGSYLFPTSKGHVIMEVEEPEED